MVSLSHIPPHSTTLFTEWRRFTARIPPHSKIFIYSRSLMLTSWFLETLIKIDKLVDRFCLRQEEPSQASNSGDITVTQITAATLPDAFWAFHKRATQNEVLQRWERRS